MKYRPQSILLTLASTLTLWLFAAYAAADTGQDQFSAALAKGPLYAGLVAFGGGLAVSLTPCVYPMIAITVSIFGGQKTQSRARGTLLSLAFVLGIVAMFVPLGVVAGITGSAFGSVLSSPWVISGISALFVAMAISMFGGFDLQLPSGLQNRLAQVGGAGPMGAFLLGVACGPIAAPCTGPVLTGILAWIAKTQDATLGGAAMAAFALGLGAPFFLVGAFAVQLPRGGRWTVHIKSLLGIILLVAALYFLNTAFPALGSVAAPTMSFLFITAGIALFGVLLGAVHRSFEDAGWSGKIYKGVGVVLTTAGAFLFITGFMTPERTLTWEKVPETNASKTAALARTKAQTEGRPLLMDFTASWCMACKEIEKLTFTDERVQAEAGRFVAVKIDATDDSGPGVEETLQAYSIRGLPTVILFDSSGNESTRFNDFVDAEKFLNALKSVN